MENENNRNIPNNENNYDSTETENTASEKAYVNSQPVPKKKKRIKKKKSRVGCVIGIIMLAIILAGVIAGAVAVYQIWDEYTHTTSGEESVTVTIPQGSSGAKIARILEENGVIKNQLAFRWKLKNSPYRNQLNYGVFELKKNMAYNDIIDALRRISVMKDGVTVTIPEGYSAEMIGALCEEKGLVTKVEFLKELSEGEFEYDFIKNIPDVAGVKYKLQGYLFPSTYIFAKDADAHEIIDILLGEFEKQYNNAIGGQKLDMSMNEIIVRASLIEREAKLDSERQTISGVIQNRLDIGMDLGIDAMVVYVITDGMYDADKVLYRDLEVDSPYNTYRQPRLPVGAICNPGVKSIIAAAYPEEHSYLYYHTDAEKNDGSHIFTETFSEHLATQ